MRILHVVSGDVWAGAEVQVRNLVAAQLAAGHDVVHLAVLNHGRLVDECRQLGAAVAVLDESGRSGLSILVALVRLIHRWKISHVHTHRQKEHILGALAALTRPGTRSLRTVHGEPEAAVAFHDVRRRLLAMMERVAARWLQYRTVTVSHELAQRMHTRLPAGRIATIFNGIDMPAQHYTRAYQECDRSDRLRVAFFGRLVPVKRLDLVLKIAAMLESEQPGKFVFGIHGDGPLRVQLEDDVHTQSLEKTVVFHGFVDEPMSHMAVHDVLLVTSDHEGLPTAVLEAMAVGTPVVARAVGGIPEVLRNGLYGSLVPDESPDSFARLLMEMRLNPAPFHARADAGREAVIGYSSENMAAAYRKIYQAGVEPRMSA